MAKRLKEGSLTKDEKRAVKAMLAEDMRNQDIQDLVNRGRNATINSARITEVKSDDSQEAATSDELELFKLKKTLYDPITGLNDVDDERLIRAREAMMMAVHIFNSPHLKFRTEQFSVLAIIAWTYLMHEYHDRTLGESIARPDGKTVSLYELLSRQTTPLSNNVRRNLVAIKEIRDAVEHSRFGLSDNNWLGLFQACCVNFDNTICDLFGPMLSLQSNLGFALQFSRVSLMQISETQDLAVPANIMALDARLNSDIDPDDPGAVEYKFQIVFTLDGSSRSGSNIRFISPDSEEGENIHNVLVKSRISDEDFPHKPLSVVRIVRKAVPDFTSHCHQLAWKRHNARPASGAKQPGQTDKRYCVYHSAHRDYTYSQAWVDFLIATYSNPSEIEALRKTQS